MRLPNLLATPRGRLTTFFFLYVTEGIPLGFAAIAVATQLRRQDVGPAAIGAFVGSFYLPWAFKWAFGPFIDVFASERLGRRRGWIIVTQVAMALTLMSTVFLKLPQQLAAFTVVLLVHNTFGAMQDVAIDALAVNTLGEHERGLANGLMFAGAAIGQAVGGSGVLFLSGVTGFQPTFFFVAGSILAVTLFVALPMREAPSLRPRSEGPSRWRAAGAQMRSFAVESFRSFLGTRGAFVGLAFALLPSGAMCLGLALQSNLAVELGLDDDRVALLNLWSSVISAGFMVLGGYLSDRYGRRRTLAVYIASMSLPVLYLMSVLQQYGWMMPVPQGGANPVVAPAALVLALWVATLTYAVAQGLMYGARSAIFMDVTNPAVAATQFTAYMALLNLGIAYSATWQGIAIEAIGYPMTMLIDAVFGLACLLLLPWMRAVRGNAPDGGAPQRARLSAVVLGLACIAWLPYRLQTDALGAAAPIFETVFTVVFVASALFLLAGVSVLTRVPRAWLRAGAWMALLLLSMYARRWLGALSTPLADGAALLVLVVPPAAGALLLALAAQGWQELDVAGTEVPAASAHAGAAIR
ncbi:MAG TPA: MFS transporter [Burkholderiaceae bacterium]|nr:MFS transporter [Burkholderiaceae bacterium]